ncbi:hypothetical protein ACQP1P_24585 [Dactylosporangium sp. CA-052675]|uniref:hypothetical protein n=1 Tax=Dactylosporangium sp. CA-052675 TaxID=3239927 RepID=UPI003D8D7C82
MSDVTAPPPVRPLRELLPHLVWEAVLLLVAIGVAVTLYSGKGERLFTSGGIWLPIASLGFATTGLALSLRTGTPNLAVGPLASLAAFLYADQGMGVAILAVAGLGLLLALVAGLTGVPAWAVTLIGGLAVSATVIGGTGGKVTPLHDAPGGPRWTWGIAFILLSVAGGVVFAIPAVRRYLSANRPAGGETGAFSVARLVGALAGVFGSSVLAAVAGVVLTIQQVSAGPIDPGFTLAGLVCALLAGVSPFGRRAGVLGVVLAVVIFVCTRYLLTLANLDVWITMLVEALIGLAGVLVVWLLELIGRRTSPYVAATAPRPAPMFTPGPPPPYAPAPFAPLSPAPPPPPVAPPMSAPPAAPPGPSRPPAQ